jgi:CelD/BcsL family acetyltransferase involved in cellulose biosynthesis
MTGCELVDEASDGAMAIASGETLVVSRARSLASLAGQWNSLSGERPFCAYEWLAPWWRHFGAGKQLFTLSVHNERQELVAIAPWSIERSLSQGRVIRFLGSGAVCSDYLTVLSRPEYEDAVAGAIGGWLAGPAAGRWDLLELTGVRPSDPVVWRLVGALAAGRHEVHERSDQSCWRVELPNTWDQFLSGLSASRRQRTRTLLRRAFDSGRARLARVTNQEQLDRGFEALVDLHTRRRQSLGQNGCFAVAGFTEFLREAAQGMLATGRLRMFWLELEGRPIAVEFGLLGAGVVHYYQGGFDPEAADERPGWLCFAASIRAAIEEGCCAYDFLRGDEAYKASWNAASQAMIEIRVVPPRPLARLRHAAWNAENRLKRLARRWKQAGSRRLEILRCQPPPGADANAPRIQE